MPVLEPFRGVRYDQTVPLDKVVAPPYDVIDAEQRAELAARHPANAVAVEVPETPQAGGDPYQHAAELLDTWRRRGLLRTDPQPALYLYRMQAPDGFATSGVLGAVRLPAEGSDEVRPHEQTLPKPLGDRLHLLRATRANLSPIWLLSTGRGLAERLATDGPPTSEAKDDDGVLHQLWRIDQPDRIAEIAGVVGSAPLVVADGHHRFQTALHYAKEAAGGEKEAAGGEKEAAGGETAADRPEGALLAYVVELSPGQLRVGAIHRLLSGLSTPAAALEAFGERFDAVRAGPARETVASALVESGNLGLVTPDGVWLLSERSPSDAGTDRDVLDPQRIAPVLESLGEPEVRFAHGPEEAVREVTGGRADAAVLLRPVSVELISRWAREERLMPPKTTYFWPKLRTGMVFRLLDV